MMHASKNTDLETISIAAFCCGFVFFCLVFFYEHKHFYTQLCILPSDGLHLLCHVEQCTVAVSLVSNDVVVCHILALIDCTLICVPILFCFHIRSHETQWLLSPSIFLMSGCILATMGEKRGSKCRK